jgi:FKBP-type peptidyl-prolyl cis-trans isomerase FkpA
MKRFVVLLGMMLAAASCGTDSEPEPVVPPASEEVQTLQIIDHEIGDGDEAVAGRTVEVHYTGWLYANGERGDKFDSSVDRGDPFQFGLGAGQVIRGWDEGVQGMKVGGRRELIIPAEMGYGAQGAGGVIPPNATLNFEVQLLRVF